MPNFHFRQSSFLQSEDAWFISTNLGSFSQVINSYQKRFGIEELLRG